MRITMCAGEDRFHEVCFQAEFFDPITDPEALELAGRFAASDYAQRLWPGAVVTEVFQTDHMRELMTPIDPEE